MANKKPRAELVRGHATHRRTESDYMGVLLNAVTLDDWREVVNNAKTMAQGGDPHARAWLAQYLMGKPGGKAPTPLTVVVAQLNGADPLVDKLAHRAIMAAKYPETDDGWEDEIRTLVVAELLEKIKPVEVIENRATSRVSAPLTAD